MDVDDKKVHDSLQAQAHTWNHLFNFINSMSLRCAVELCIPEAIHKHGGQPITLPQLLSELGISHSRAPFLARLMRLLTHSGFFTVQCDGDGQDAYLLNNLSAHLLRDNPHGFSPFLLTMLDPVQLTPWLSLGAWFRSDSPTAFHLLHGTSVWELAGQMPELNSMINKAMASDSRLVMDLVIREHADVFHELESLVDVGGGNGAAAAALAEAFPQMKCSVFDLPHVVNSARKSTVAVDFIAGDMFDHVPQADAVMLKWVLHDWSDEHCMKLLKLCKEAIPPKEEGGKVIVIDMVMTREDAIDHKSRETQLFFDLLMMVHNEGGKERSEEEWRKLFHVAGFSGYKITPLGLGLRSIIELYP